MGKLCSGILSCILCSGAEKRRHALIHTIKKIFRGYTALCWAVVSFAIVVFVFGETAWGIRLIHNVSEAGIGLFILYRTTRWYCQKRLHDLDPENQRSRENMLIIAAGLIIAGAMI